MGGAGECAHQLSSCSSAAILTGSVGKRVCRLLISPRPEPTSRRWPISVVERWTRGVRCSEPANGNGGLCRCWRGCGGHLVAAGCAARRVFAEAGAAAGPAWPASPGDGTCPRPLRTVGSAPTLRSSVRCGPHHVLGASSGSFWPGCAEVAGPGTAVWFVPEWGWGQMGEG